MDGDDPENKNEDEEEKNSGELNLQYLTVIQKFQTATVKNPTDLNNNINHRI